MFVYVERCLYVFIYIYIYLHTLYQTYKTGNGIDAEYTVVADEPPCCLRIIMLACSTSPCGGQMVRSSPEYCLMDDCQQRSHDLFPNTCNT